MQDPEKIRQIIQKLNNEETGVGKGHWSEAEGYHSIQAMELKDGKAAAIPNSAVFIKLFINGVTGEARIYWLNKVDTESAAIPLAPSSTNTQH